jgi:(S)-2-hydroxy-acid oxidase
LEGNTGTCSKPTTSKTKTLEIMANRAPPLDPLVHSIRDLETQGSSRLPQEYRSYYNGGSMDMITYSAPTFPVPGRHPNSLAYRLQDNVSAFDRYKILPRILRNVSNLNTSTQLFGTTVAFPCGLSPSAMHCLAHPDGEVATSRAAAKIGVPMALSSYSTTSLEDVKAEGRGNPYMMQMCVLKDRSITTQLLQRAESKQQK